MTVAVCKLQDEDFRNVRTVNDVVQAVLKISGGLIGYFYYFSDGMILSDAV